MGIEGKSKVGLSFGQVIYKIFYFLCILVKNCIILEHLPTYIIINYNSKAIILNLFFISLANYNNHF